MALALQRPASDSPARAPRGLRPSADPWGDAASARGLQTWAWLAIAGALAAGLLLIALAFELSREQRPHGLVLFWAGLLLAAVPTAVAIAFGRPTRNESAALLVLFGAGLYLVKVMNSPFRFTYADELSHVWNVDRILATGRLPTDNVALPVTTHFPGLETLTAGLASTAGLSSFTAGLVVVGVARCILELGLFTVFELISGSTRVAALAAVYFAFDPELLYWSAQFSYESLALPLALVVLTAALSRRRGHFLADRRAARPWTAVALIGIAALTPTHHITSYAVAAVLLVLAVASFVSQKRGWRAPWDLAVVAAVASAAWFAFRATIVGSYLHDIFLAAYGSAKAIVTGAALPRKPFQSTIYHVPIAERAVAIVGLLVIALLVAYATLRRGKRVFRDPFTRLFWLSCCGYLGSYVLRFVPSAWEIANRASEFLLVGTSLVLALSGVHLALRRAYGAAGMAAFAVMFGVGFASGVIGGWPPPAQLASPLEVATAGTTILPQGYTAADWAERALPAGARFIADESNGRLLFTIAHDRPSIGLGPPTKAILQAPAFGDYELAVLRRSGARYVLIDRRKIANDNILGYFFDRDDRPVAQIDPAIWQKFEHAPWADRVYDSGNILVYRLRAVPSA
jgi:hypothetical protein